LSNAWQMTTSSLLHTDGFVVHPNVIGKEDLPGILLDARSQILRKSRVIFNHNLGRKRNDFKRRQITLRVQNKRLRTFTQNMKNLVAKHYPALAPTVSSSMPSMVVLHSASGCQVQMPHTDYVANDDLLSASDAEMPLGCLIALERATKLYVWPKCIRQAPFDPAAVKKVYLKPGDALVFRGDLVHAGADYRRPNTRLHVYLDSPKVKRTRNQTYFITAQQKK